MKKYALLMLSTVAAAALVSCVKETAPEEGNVTGKKTIKVYTDVQTKTTLDENHANLVWTSDDEISVFNNQSNDNAKLSYTGNSVEVPSGTTEIYGHYPYFSGNASGPKSVSVYISNAQNQKNPGELNGYYYPMVAKATVTNNTANMVFYPVAGALALNIYNSNLSGTETVKSVKVTPAATNTSFYGSQSTDITGSNVKYTEGTGTGDAVTVTLTNGLSLASSAPSNKQTFAGQIYVCLAKQSYANVKFEITTDKYVYEITSNATPFDLVNNDFVPVNIDLKKAKCIKEIYSTGFDYTMSGTSYQSSTPIVGTDDGATTSWSIVYGNWNGSACAQLRVYSAGNFGSIYNNFDCSKVTSVSYSAKVSNTALKLNTYYSTDGGTNWTKVDDAKELTTTATTYSFVVSETGEYDTVRIKFEATGTKPSSSNYALTIDDVKIMGFGQVLLDPTISLSASTVTLPYQGTAQSIDVTSNYEWLADFVKNESYSLTITPDTGNSSNATGEVTSVSISAPENTANEEITLGTIDFYDYATSVVKATLTVKQEARPANGVSVSNGTPQLASGIGSTVTVNVTCNWDWEATLTSGSGFTFTPASGSGNGSITITSTVASGAEGVITLTDKDDKTSTCTITVSQAEAGSVAVGTIMWSETWQGGTAGETPSEYGQEGTTVYNGGSVTYTNGGTNTKLYDDTMSTTNLLLAKQANSGTWTISGIPTAGVSSLTLSFETNNTAVARYAISTTTEGVTLGSISTSGSSSPYTATATITITGTVSTFDLTFTNGSSSNVRLDNLSIVTAE